MSSRMNQSAAPPLRAFGKETRDGLFVDNRVLDEFVRTPIAGLAKFVETLHYDPTHPENANLRVTNVRLPHVHTFDGHRWTLTDTDVVMAQVLCTYIDILEAHVEFADAFDRLGPDAQEAYEDFCRRYDDTNHELMQQVRHVLREALRSHIKIAELPRTTPPTR